MMDTLSDLVVDKRLAPCEATKKVPNSFMLFRSAITADVTKELKAEQAAAAAEAEARDGGAAGAEGGATTTKQNASRSLLGAISKRISERWKALGAEGQAVYKEEYQAIKEAQARPTSAGGVARLSEQLSVAARDAAAVVISAGGTIVQAKQVTLAAAKAVANVARRGKNYVTEHYWVGNKNTWGKLVICFELMANATKGLSQRTNMLLEVTRRSVAPSRGGNARPPPPRPLSEIAT